MFCEAKKTASSIRDARGIFASDLTFTMGERWHRRPNGGRSASFTTKAARTNKTHFAGKNILRARTGSVISRHAAGITSRAKEGFERTHLQEKIQFYNVARGSAGEVRSLLYVISDNYARSAAETDRLRESAIGVGKLVSGLLQSTEARKGKLPRTLSILLTPIFYLLSALFDLLSSPMRIPDFRISAFQYFKELRHFQSPSTFA